MNKSIKKLQAINLSSKTPLQLFVWRSRRLVRDVVGKDVFHTDSLVPTTRTKLRQAYRKIDTMIAKLNPSVERETPREIARKQVREILELELGYKFVDVNEKKPWGAYWRIQDEQSERFVAEFFPGLTMFEARFGREDVELSPKIMLVYPDQRLSWQYHNRRAERWRFLTPGSYHLSHSDEHGELHQGKAGDVVQFETGERHRLCADKKGYTLVAEIWQHTDPKHASDEKDIVRLHDDYDR